SYRGDDHASITHERDRSTAPASSHHPRHAAGLVPRAGDPLLQEAARRRPEIARPHIGPGAAAVFALAGRLAGRPGRIARNVEVLVVAAGAVDREFGR